MMTERTTNSLVTAVALSETCKFHPLADEWPLLEGEDFENLVEDIKAHGLREPIWLYQGMILDGRNRYRACLKAGIEPKFRQYDPVVQSDPVAFVISVNANRRNLDLNAKKGVAAKMIRRDPNSSDRSIAKAVGLDNKTVGKVRERLATELKEFKETWKILGRDQQRDFAETFKEQLRSLLARIIHD